MRKPDYDRGETIDDVADEAHARAVQEKLDDIIEAQPQKCSFCPQIFADPKCPGCNEERPAFTALKNISAQQLKAAIADDSDVARIARACGAI